MNRLKLSFTCTGILLIIEGLFFLFVPHLTTKLLLLEPLKTTQSVQYARTTGATMSIIGYYYLTAGKFGLIDFYRASLTGRIVGVPLILLLVIFNVFERSFLFFAIQDLLCTIWSYRQLRLYEN